MTRTHAGRIAALLLATLVAVGGAWAAGSGKKTKKPTTAPTASAAREVGVLIRPTYEAGRMLRYRLDLRGTTAWTPGARELNWGRMTTDFDFILRTKTLRDSGACTFELLGQTIKSVGEGPGSALGIQADREKARITVGGKSTDVKNSPLTKPMTMTFAPRGQYMFGTGLAPIVIYMAPHVDGRFWRLLTVAPLGKVAPGDEWEVDFNTAVPGSKPDKPLNVKARWKVVGWETYRRQKVLAIALAAKLDLKGTNVILRNGDRIHVAGGDYIARGKVLWDVEHGQLVSAQAEQKLLVKSDKPAARAVRSESRVSLKLTQARSPAAKKK